MRVTGIAVLAILLATQFAMADTVTTKDGRVLDGRIIQQNDDKVVLEITKYGANMQVSLDRNDVVSLKESPVFKVAPAATSRPASRPAGGSTSKPDGGATYYLIPIKGEIGKDVQKETVRQALLSARNKKATYVVFQIDSLGGSVGETEEILGMMMEKSDQRRVALVTKAISSGAVLSMACTDIFMEPGATIGAAVPISSGSTPQPIEEKTLSTIRAMARSAAEVGNHNSLLIQGMMEMDLELALAMRDGKPVVAAGHDPSTAFPGETETKAAGPGKTPARFCWSKVLKAKGQILTLTAHEAVDCGLARDVVPDDAAIGKSFGLERWTDVTGLGKAMTNDLTKKGRATAERAAYMESVKPLLDKINTDLEKAASDLENAQNAKDLLSQQFETEKAYAKTQFDQAMVDARGYVQNQSIGMQANARATYDGKISNLLAKYADLARPVQKDIYNFTTLKKQLTAQKNKIMQAAPKAPSS